MNSQMTDFALAGKCTARGASGLTTAPAAAATDGRSNWSPSRLESATRPRPLPARLRKSRREAKEGDGGAKILGTFMDSLANLLYGVLARRTQKPSVPAVLEHAEKRKAGQSIKTWSLTFAADATASLP